MTEGKIVSDGDRTVGTRLFDGMSPPYGLKRSRATVPLSSEDGMGERQSGKVTMMGMHGVSMGLLREGGDR